METETQSRGVEWGRRNDSGQSRLTGRFKAMEAKMPGAVEDRQAADVRASVVGASKDEEDVEDWGFSDDSSPGRRTGNNVPTGLEVQPR